MSWCYVKDGGALFFIFVFAFKFFFWGEDGFSALQIETKVKNLIHFSPPLMQL